MNAHSETPAPGQKPPNPHEDARGATHSRSGGSLPPGPQIDAQRRVQLAFAGFGYASLEVADALDDLADAMRESSTPDDQAPVRAPWPTVAESAETIRMTAPKER